MLLVVSCTTSFLGGAPGCWTGGACLFRLLGVLLYSVFGGEGLGKSLLCLFYSRFCLVRNLKLWVGIKHKKATGGLVPLVADSLKRLSAVRDTMP